MYSGRSLTFKEKRSTASIFRVRNKPKQTKRKEFPAVWSGYFNHKDWGNTSFRNVDKLLPDHTLHISEHCIFG